MGQYNNPRIPTDNLILFYDAANPNCYPGSGTTFTNLMKAERPDLPSMSFYFSSSYGSVSNGVITIGGLEDGTNNNTGTFLRGLGSIGSTVNSDFTTIGWLRRTTSDSGEVLSYRETFVRLAFDIQNSQMVFYQRETTPSYSTRSTSVSVTNELNTWNCYALVRSGNNWSFYKDGSLLGTNNFVPTETISGGGAYHVGCAWSDDDYVSNAMEGDIGPIMHWTRALDAGEVQQVYYAHKKRFQS